MTAFLERSASRLGPQYHYLPSTRWQETTITSSFEKTKSTLFLPLSAGITSLSAKKEDKENDKNLPQIEEKPLELPPEEEKTPEIEQKGGSDEMKQIEMVETPQIEQKPNDELAKRYKDSQSPTKIEPQIISNGFRRIFEDAISRIVRRETIAVHRGIKRQDLNAFESYMEDFYSGLPEFISSTLHPSVTSYAEMINSTDATGCISTYMNNHVKESKDEIAKWPGIYLFTATSDNGIRANEKAIDDCLDLWAEKRPEYAATFFENFFVTT